MGSGAKKIKKKKSTDTHMKGFLPPPSLGRRLSDFCIRAVPEAKPPPGTPPACAKDTGHRPPASMAWTPTRQDSAGLSTRRPSQPWRHSSASEKPFQRNPFG